MEGLLSFLIFGALFFLMMRFGCGAHMKHGGHNSDQHDQHDQQTTSSVEHTDPVCGMAVDMNQGYGKMHAGQLYRFCSRNCLDQFEENPGKYLQQPTASSGGAT